MDSSVKPPTSESIREHSKDQLSPLELLPAELRNHIYCLAVIDSGDLNISKARRQPSLAATNSKTRGEVLPIFYGKNTFLAEASDVFGDIHTFEECINSIDKYLPLMRCVGVYEVTLSMRLGYKKLCVRIKDDLSLQVWFHDHSAKAPTCLCSIQKIAQEERGKEYDETLPRRLLFAAASDINQTMELIGWKWPFAAAPKATGCEKCKDFRKFAGYL